MSTTRLLTRFDYLPDVLNLCILEYLTIKELINTLSVSQHWLKYNRLELKTEHRKNSGVSSVLMNTFKKILKKSAETEHAEKIAVEKVKLLISLGVNFRDPEVIGLAAAAGNTEILRLLHNHGVDFKQESHMLILDYAIQNNRASVIEFLHEIDYRFGQRSDLWGLALLAVVCESVECILTLGNLGILLGTTPADIKPPGLGGDFRPYKLLPSELVDSICGAQHHRDKNISYQKILDTLKALLKAGVVIRNEKEVLSYFRNELQFDITKRFPKLPFVFKALHPEFLIEKSERNLYRAAAIEIIQKHCVEQQRHSKVFQSFFKSKQVKPISKEIIELSTFAMLNK